MHRGVDGHVWRFASASDRRTAGRPEKPEAKLTMPQRPRKPRSKLPHRRPPPADVPVVSSAAPPVAEAEGPREGTDLSDETIRRMLEAAYT